MHFPRANPPFRWIDRLAAAGAAIALIGGLAVGAAPAATATTPGVTPSAGVFAVHGSGNGHGHGMSQYGAQGAAIAGRTTPQILGFYYPGTTLSRLPVTVIRVRLSGGSAYATVYGGFRGLSVTGYGALPVGVYWLFRLVPFGTGLALAGWRQGVWTTLSTRLPAAAGFASTGGFVRMLRADGSATRYRGRVGAVRSATSEYTVNWVSLDNYTAGVVPREMPASWRTAAVGAQAVAARTYGRNGVLSSVGDPYDICDTTSCQVYGGMQHFSATGSLLWTEDQAAILGNQNTVLIYAGSVIFAQFSASNGGASVYGGQPYLVGRVDPYDNAASGDPYLNWADHATATSVAGYYGLRTVTSILITRRDGIGAGGGRVLSATVYGTNSAGAAAQVATTGYGLAAAMSLLTSYFHFDPK